MRPHRSALIAVPLMIVALAALSGCVPTDGDPGPTPSATRSPSPTATPSATPSPTATAGTDTPLTIGCDALVTPQEMYDYNPNFAEQGDYVPAAGSPGAEAVTRGGVACAWVNLTSGEIIEVAAAQPAPEVLTSLANDLVMSSNSVPTFGVEGYFTVADGVGVAHAFPAPFWVTASSASFAEPGDAEPLMRAAINGVG